MLKLPRNILGIPLFFIIITFAIHKISGSFSKIKVDTGYMPSKVSAAFSYSENRDNRHYMKRSQFNEQEFSLEQQRVRTMMKHAWSGYYEYARDSDELMPLTKKGSNWTQSSLSLTAIDALDTLFIMKLETEYQQAKDIILKYDFDTIDYPINHFETNIRVLGGLLSAYEMDPDNRYLDLAIDLADRLLKAFNTPTGFPYFDIDLANGTKFNGPFFLSNAGTLQLEFQYLSDVTGNSIYQDTALFIYEQLHFMDKPIPGLFPKDISATELKFGGPNYGIAGNADSFYEYLLKIYVSTGLEKFKAWYVTAAKVEFINKALVEHILVKKDGYLYAPDAIGSEHQPEFYHLVFIIDCRLVLREECLLWVPKQSTLTMKLITLV